MAAEAGGDTILRHAREWLETPGATAAAQALIIVSACDDGAVKATRRCVRYAFVVRCRAELESGDKKAFFEKVEDAFGRKLSREERSAIQNSYFKVVEQEGLPPGWRSVSQALTAAREDSRIALGLLHDASSPGSCDVAGLRMLAARLHATDTAQHAANM